MKIKTLVPLASLLFTVALAGGCSKIMQQRPYKDEGQVKNLIFLTDIRAEDRFTGVEGSAEVYRVLPGCKGKEFLGNINLDNGRSSASLPVNELMFLRFTITKTTIKAQRTKIEDETLLKIGPGERVTVSYYYNRNKYRYGIKVKPLNGREENRFMIPWTGCSKMI